MAGHNRGLSATFVPTAGGFDDFYMPPAPELQAPAPQRMIPEVPGQITRGIANLDLRTSLGAQAGHAPQRSHDWSALSPRPDGNNYEVPHLSPFPKLQNRPQNVPPSNDEVEATLEAARPLVLNSNDPEMQLAWAQDALIDCGVSADNEERITAAQPQQARPSTPAVEHQLKTDAMNIVTFLADQHHPKAEFMKGMWLEWGRFGVRDDKREAFRCYSRAADRGYARAEYRIGMLYESYNDPVKALRHYMRGVDAGDAASCYRLGMMTLRGQHGQQQDYTRAVELIRKSAEVADENAAQGAYVFGMLLAKQLPQVEIPETFLPYNEAEARANIEKAAYLKFAKAQLKMGSAYELGTLGCEFSPALSIHYNALASKQGEAEADIALSKWFLVGSDGLFPKNEELAYTYAEKASQGGLATAEFALGYFNEIGMYVPVDLEKAMDWYEKAARHGNEDAKGRVVGLNKKQVLSKKDHENVAITRIKSQYGSQRGKRPERFRQPQQASRLGGDDGYANGSTPTATTSLGNGVQPPPRGSSMTPYPADDGPPTLPPDNRPQSVAPYPLEDGPPKPGPRLGPMGGFFNASRPGPMAYAADNRPSSALHLNHELRSDSAVTVPQLPSQGGRMPTPVGILPPHRPMTAVHPSDPRLRPGAGQRIASGPAGVQQYAHPLQQATPVSPQPTPLQHAPTQPVPQQHPPPARMDIGYSAPPDGRRIRRPGPPRLDGAKPLSPMLQSPTSYPDFSQTPKPGRTSTPNSPNSRPGSRPPESRRPVNLTDDGPKPSAQDSAAKPATRKPARGGGAKPPGRGPKTFEEMGVPSHKQDQECVVM